MKIIYKKTCPRCGRTHNRKGYRYCDPCERTVVAEMYDTRYLEDRHMRSKLPQQPKVSEVKP